MAMPTTAATIPMMLSVIVFFQLESTFNSTPAIKLGKVTISMGKIRRRAGSSLMSGVRCGFSSNDSSWSYPNSIRGRKKGPCLPLLLIPFRSIGRKLLYEIILVILKLAQNVVVPQGVVVLEYACHVEPHPPVLVGGQLLESFSGV
jgi:hypothetical protein